MRTLCSLLLLAACSGPDTDSGSEDDTDPVIECDPAPVGACGAPALCGDTVPEIKRGGSPPSPSGGTVAPGIYVIEAFVLYDGEMAAGEEVETGLQTRQTLVFEADKTYREVSSLAGGEPTEIGGTWSTTGRSLARLLDCGGVSNTWDYSASPTKLTLLSGDWENVYTLVGPV